VAVFENPRDLRTVPLVTGEVRVERSTLRDPSCPSEHAELGGQTWVPVVSYLVEHPSEGAFMIDAGLPRVGPELIVSGSVRQVEGHDVLSLLQAAGRPAEELEALFVSHFHLDHVFAVPVLPSELPIVAGPNALDAYEPLVAFHFLDSARTIEVLDFGCECELPAIDIFGDGSLFALSTPGHTAGHISFLINARSGPVLLLHDAAHLLEGFASRCGPGEADDRLEATRSIEALADLVARFPRIRVIAGHDPSQWDVSAGVQDAL
jgi:N-acyl homoserine lactone hydrolase